MSESVLRLVLDQNFPQPLLRDVGEWIPPEVEIVHLGNLDDRLRTVSDRELFIALHQLGYDGLITSNWKMLNIPMEVAAIIATKAVVIAMRSMGHDPIRAAGALLLELPGLVERIRPNRANVFLLHYERRRPEDAWEYLKRIADRESLSPQGLLDRVRVTSEELANPIL
ncbi:hypothetical protein OG801_26200 [Nocardioides sp. NBC_00163]|uniref:hypothetical protein n=1 Tax=Nocardioides sp. NBC_00163 TaxID=2975999 RepID=UPI00324D1E4E